MALIKCPECGREKVSHQAIACPDCGYGIKEHYLKLKRQAERKKQAIESEKQEEEQIKKIPKPVKPTFAGVVLLIIFTIFLVVTLICVICNDDFRKKDDMQGIMFLAMVILGFLIGTIILIKDYKDKLKKYNYILANFEEYQKEQYKKKMEWERNMGVTQKKVDRKSNPGISASYSTSMKVECPYCHSKNTRKISGASKVGNVALFGIFAAGKVSKQWHCNQCRSDF